MSRKLLLADDSITIQKVVGITFAQEDFDITYVDNGLDAISKVKELKPDIVLADIVMPKKNGYEVCEAVKNDPDTKTIPVLLLAGTFETFDVNRGKMVGAEDYIIKPFESQALIDKVNTLITGGGLPAAEPAAATFEIDAELDQEQTAVEVAPAAAEPPVLDVSAEFVAPEPAPAATPEPEPSEPAAGGFGDEFGFSIDDSSPAAAEPEALPIEPAAAVEEPAASDFSAADLGFSGSLEPDSPAAEVGNFDISLDEPAAVLDPNPAADAMPSFDQAAIAESAVAEPAMPAAPLEQLPEPELELPPLPEENSFELEQPAVAAQQSEPAAQSDPISDEQVRNLLDSAARDIIERVAWEVVPELAETIIREEIKRLTKGAGSS